MMKFMRGVWALYGFFLLAVAPAGPSGFGSAQTAPTAGRLAADPCFALAGATPAFVTVTGTGWVPFSETSKYELFFDGVFQTDQGPPLGSAEQPNMTFTMPAGVAIGSHAITVQLIGLDSGSTLETSINFSVFGPPTGKAIQNAVEKITKHAKNAKEEVDANEKLTTAEKTARKDAIDAALAAALAALDKPNIVTNQNAGTIEGGYEDMINIIKFGVAPTADCRMSYELLGGDPGIGVVDIPASSWQGALIKLTIIASCTDPDATVKVEAVEKGIFSDPGSKIIIPAGKKLVPPDDAPAKNGYSGNLFIDATKGAISNIFVGQWQAICTKGGKVIHKCNAVVIFHLGC